MADTCKTCDHFDKTVYGPDGFCRLRFPPPVQAFLDNTEDWIHDTVSENDCCSFYKDSCS